MGASTKQSMSEDSKPSAKAMVGIPSVSRRRVLMTPSGVPSCVAVITASVATQLRSLDMLNLRRMARWWPDPR